MKLTWVKGPHAQIGDYPSKAVTLHFHFAKLFVGFHVFRGLSSDAAVDPIPAPFMETAMMAVDSAKSIVDLILHDADIRTAFVGMPHYFHTMIAFACSFLLKVSTMYRKQIAIEVQNIFDVISRVVEFCKNCQCTPYHLVHWIGEGLQVLLSRCKDAMSRHDCSRERSGPRQFDPNERLEETQEASSQHNNLDNGIVTAGSLGAVWNTAREAAMFHPSDGSPFIHDYPFPSDEKLEGMDGMNNESMAFQNIGGLWEAPTMNFDVEQMGFGLL